MKSLFTQYLGLPREVAVLAAARAIAAAGAFIMPMLTLILIRKLGLSTAEAGVIISLASLSYMPGSLIGGKLADMLGRRRVILAAKTVAGISWILCGFFPQSAAVLPFVFIAYICMGAMDPTITALISDVTHPDERKTAYSLSYLGHNLGYALGPLVAGFLFLNHAHWMFWGDGLTTLLAAALIWRFVPDSRPGEQQQAHTAQEASVTGPVWPVLRARPWLLWFTLANFLLVLCYAQLFFSMPLQLDQLFGDEGARNYGWLMTVNAITVLLFTPLLIALTRKYHAINNLVLTGLLYLVGFGAIYWINSLWLLLLTTVIWTLGEILSSTNANAYIASHSPQSHRGRINSILPLIYGSAFSLGPLLMGQFIEWQGVRQIWLLLALLAAIGALCMLWLGISETRREIRHKAQTAE